MFGEEYLCFFFYFIIGCLVNVFDVLVIFIDEIFYGEKRVGFGFEEFVVDGVIVFELERMGEVIRRYFMIFKMCGRLFKCVVYEYVIIDRGFEVFVIFEFEFIESEVLKFRFKIGIFGLDEFFGGGFYEGSIILIVGLMGLGKMILVFNFVFNLLKFGKKVFYIVYEESFVVLRDILEKFGFEENFRIVLMVLEGRIFVEYYVLIKDFIEKEGFDVFVIDFLLVMESYMDEKEFIKVVCYF